MKFRNLPPTADVKDADECVSDSQANTGQVRGRFTFQVVGLVQHEMLCVAQDRTFSSAVG